jgi:hypothetical protein
MWNVRWFFRLQIMNKNDNMNRKHSTCGDEKHIRFVNKHNVQITKHV